ncbi:carboxyl transferase domain-containing protein [Frankia sp. Cr1]|uniref:carboxyl transferase domain-containing protein n=1 Tax=Frankia sp. Cr1 TaxID=3073931 RepID=UPI002AD22195|nr:carboxyl transferase domain-containing protein [Frankia sp. Cr1]
MVADPRAAATEFRERRGPVGLTPDGGLALTVKHPNCAELLDLLLDAGSWTCWDGAPEQPTVSAAYGRDLSRAAARSGRDESIRTGAGRVAGHRVAVVASEYDFLGGSVGRAAARRATAAIERATAEKRVLLALPASGGTRIQEGTPAFLQMLTISAAIAGHRAASLPYLVYLRHPTTGGVLASWASLGHVTFAEPGALVGFLGPRVVEALTGAALARDAQSPRALRRAGVVDAVVAPADLREAVQRVLRVVAVDRGPTTAESGAGAQPAGVELVERGEPDHTGDPWASVLATRAPDRPGLREFLAASTSDLTLLGASELGQGPDVPGTPMVTALALLRGIPCVVIGQDREAQRHQPIGVRALHAAQHAVQRAADLRLPIVTVIDTPGAELSEEAERSGLAAAIAHCLAALLSTPVPTVSVLLGQGAGGAALALLPADAVVAAEDAWLAPLPPEGASTIMHRTVDHAAEMARELRITAGDLYRLGAVDVVVARGPAGVGTTAGLAGLAGAVAHCLAGVAVRDAAARLAARRDRHRRLSP